MGLLYGTTKVALLELLLRRPFFLPEKEVRQQEFSWRDTDTTTLKSKIGSNNNSQALLSLDQGRFHMNTLISVENS